MLDHFQANLEIHTQFFKLKFSSPFHSFSLPNSHLIVCCTCQLLRAALDMWLCILHVGLYAVWNVEGTHGGQSSVGRPTPCQTQDSGCKLVFIRTWGEKGPPMFSLPLVAVGWSVLSKVLRRKVQQTPNLELHAHWPQKWHFVQQQGQTAPAPCCKGLGWTLEAP